MEMARYRPALVKNRGFFPDVQGRLPYGWCQNCASEVFEPDRQLCRRCQKVGALQETATTHGRVLTVQKRVRIISLSLKEE